MRKIVEDKIPSGDLPQILQTDLKYFPGIRYNCLGYPVFEHINWIHVHCMFKNFQNGDEDDWNFWNEPFPETLQN